MFKPYKPITYVTLTCQDCGAEYRMVDFVYEKLGSKYCTNCSFIHHED